jgi:hypothetical protein
MNRCRYKYGDGSTTRENGGMRMTIGAKISLGFTLLVSVVVLGLFLIIYIPAISSAAKYEQPASWTKNEQKAGAATTLATLIGGIVALGFGLKPNRETADANQTDKKKLQRSFMGLGDTLTPGINPTPSWARYGISLLYTLVYLGVGLYAWTTWFFHAHGPPVPDVLKDFASAWVALASAIVYGVARDPQDAKSE